VLLMNLYELQHSGAIFVLICELVSKRRERRPKLSQKY